MSKGLPPLRALQAFDAFGRTSTVHGAARSLGVTPGAISQQLRLLEEHVGFPLLIREGRRIGLTPAARIYHEMIAQGFDRLTRASDFILAQRMSEDLVISGLPTLLQKWLHPIIHRFQAAAQDPSIRIVATHRETDPQLMDHGFRLTYGNAAARYPHSRLLFRDTCFPACSPEFLQAHPEAATDSGLMNVPLIEVDWGMGETASPTWTEWFARRGQRLSGQPKMATIYSLSSFGLEAAIAGQGVVLAQAAFAEADVESGRLIRLSDDAMPLNESYFICWGAASLARDVAREFLNWTIAQSRPRREGTVKPK
ncbi:LysR family transcriptional regulator [Xinfangfangia sp. CPCC 101601]|uniref:LysR family transcriptional regulator n=1 Tax=Pseudogemmobacter lacusdianii TaxID=3069608 RepID=A0ABU0VW93_9RHOB|nr:LysR family transcriptional regulator [Xinfangfangia sp. CPCC 101601]MDQ2066024.1 LysR family transcriptional regulator [Xinfangfangia sp. CPCC 101601]